MPASSNFQQAIREAQSSALVGPNVVNKALPYVGGGMVLTAGGVIGGLALMASNPPLFMPLFWVALIGNFILFFVAQNVAMKGNNSTALPLLTAYSLITGFTLSGIVAMAIGTAGFTAMLSVLALERFGMTPDMGPVVVTGAAGGVGSIAIALLKKAGWRVIASTGRPQEADYLRNLGADEIIDRAGLSSPGKPLGKPRWAAGVDTVGSHTLANVLAQTRYGGAVAACGLAQGMDLPTTVMPLELATL